MERTTTQDQKDKKKPRSLTMLERAGIPELKKKMVLAETLFCCFRVYFFVMSVALLSDVSSLFF